MAINNRELDSPQQRETVVNVLIDRTPSAISAGILNPVVGTGQTYVLGFVSRPMQFVVGQLSLYGLSGAPNYQLWLQRFAGGITAIQIGASLAPVAFGTSGANTVSALAAAVSFPCLAGDQLILTSTGSNTAAASVNVQLVLRNLQDIKSDMGL